MTAGVAQRCCVVSLTLNRTSSYTRVLSTFHRVTAAAPGASILQLKNRVVVGSWINQAKTAPYYYIQQQQHRWLASYVSHDDDAENENNDEEDDEEWMKYYKKLIQHRAQHGNFMFRSDFSKYPELSHWVRTQRYEYRIKGKKGSSMTQKRIHLLESIGFVWNYFNYAWGVRYQELQEYRQKFGNCLVPQNYPDNIALGKWVDLQRVRYRLILYGKLPQDRIQKLEEIGFVWDPRDAKWLQRYEELQDYRNKFGDCLVPNQYAANPKLGNWVDTQRQHYRYLKEGTKDKEGRSMSLMTPQRIESLERLGFDWDPFDTTWMNYYKELKAYKKQYRDCLVPKVYPQNQELAHWVQRQHQACKTDALDGLTSPISLQRLERRRALLDKIRFFAPPAGEKKKGKKVPRKNASKQPRGRPQQRQVKSRSSNGSE